MKLGIYMGSFNPPHKGHIKIANYLLNNKLVDKILIVPTLNYWNKTDLIDIKDRINMLRFYENENILVDAKNNKLIYTIDLVKKLEKTYSKDELFIIMGSDNIINFDKWKNYQELLKYKIIVMNRDNIDIDDTINKLGKDSFIVIKDFPSIKISSTDIRKKISSKYLDKQVLDYIKKHNLYNN